MKTFKISNNDLVIENGNLIMVDSEDEKVQSSERILTTNKNEFFLDTILGLEYSRIQGKGVTEEDVRLAITEALNQDNRVEEIEFIKVDIDRTSRSLSIDFKYTTIEGDTVEGQEVLDVG